MEPWLFPLYDAEGMRAVDRWAIEEQGVPSLELMEAAGAAVAAATGEVCGVAVEAAVTVGFHAAKVGHLIAPGKEHTGELRVAPIGVPEGAPHTPAAGVIGEGVLDLAPRRGAGSTKFSSGQVLIAG